MMKRLLEKIGGAWVFLIIVGLIYLGIGLVDFTLVSSALMVFLELFWKILPILVLVFVLMFLTSILLEPKKVAKYLGEEAGLKGWLIAIFGGILSSGPIYLWYPLLSDLKEKGMSTSLIATFLYNRAVKIPLMPMMIYYFGLPFLIVLTFYMIVFSTINGIIVEKVGG